MHTEKVIGDKSLAALAAELERELPSEARGHTVEEFAGAWRCTSREALRRVRVLVGLGKLEFTGTRRVIRANGSSDRRNAYDKPRRK